MAEPEQPGKALVLASGNAGKLRELAAILVPLGWKVSGESDWGVTGAVEDGLSFIENALIKARHASKNTGLPALGDDSGLVVDALNGAPGIYSARCAGADADDQANNLKLLRKLNGVPPEGRTAHFYCAMALVRHPDDPSPLLATGAWHGVITDTPAGVGGFGYDPLFWIPNEGCTSAELTAEKKNRLSHRGRALAQMLEQLAEF